MAGFTKPKIALAAFCLMAAPGIAFAGGAGQLFGGDDTKPAMPAPVSTNGTIWDAKRVQKLDRDVRHLDWQIGGISNRPNLGILLEPDPEVLALQATADSLLRKLDDNANTITHLTGQLEESEHQNQLLQQQASALLARTDTLVQRADAAEAHLKAIDAAMAPPPPPPASKGDAQSDFDQASSLMASGQTDDAERAFTAFTTTWPEAAQLPQAWLRLGDIHMQKKEAPDAVAAYAAALKGWPKTPWAPEATLKLAVALGDANRPTEACEAVAKFDDSYAKTASREIRAQAKDLKARNGCR